jgi:methylaspartate mutase E subunit
MQTRHSIMLGGVGGDSHSVGLTILRRALTARGYYVYYLGTQNRLESFFQIAPLFNAVMISSLDGHAQYYLREFADLMQKYKARGPLWYLGGNLHIGEGCGYERYFLDLGFRGVFVKFTGIETVLEILDKDLSGREPVGVAALSSSSGCLRAAETSPPSDDRLDPHSFERNRREVLEHWKTGHAARSLNENAEFLARQPSFVKSQAGVHPGSRPALLQPRCGVALVEGQIKLFKALKSLGASVLSYQVDSLTRNNQYAEAEEAIRESRASATSTLNGFPVVNHGVGSLRRVIREVGVPLQTRHSTRDPRLLAEISFAGGVTAFEGGAICYNIPYYKDYCLSESIRAWQYVDYLTGLYYERFGIALDREFFGTLTGTLIPPCLAIVVDLIEALLAVRQGVKCVSLGYAEQGNRIQDIAAIRVAAAMARELIGSQGHKDVQINTVFHQYMAAFPESRQRAEDLIYNSAATAAMSKATRVLIKTPVEAYRIPSLVDNAQALSLVRSGMASAAAETADETRIADECALIRREVQAIFDSVIFCGRGRLAEGVVSGFRLGLIDIPFSPSIHNQGQVMTCRDVDGAVRFLSVGNLHFDRELRQFHEYKAQERRRAEGISSGKQDYLIVERDVLQVPRGRYERWPLGAYSNSPVPCRRRRVTLAAKEE